MNSHLNNAMRQALSLVRKSSVADATNLIKRALSSEKFEVPTDATEIKFVSGVETDVSDTPAPTTKLEKSAEPAVNKAHQANSSIGNFTTRTYQHSLRDLTYMLYIPSNTSTHEQSLLIMLHGCTQTPADFALGTQMNSIADEFNLIVAYPLQPKTANSLGCWNWFDARHQKQGSGEPAMLASLAENLRKEFSISKRRVFAAGLSAGGAMAEILASTYPDQFEAVGVHSGLPHGSASSVANALSAMKGNSKLEPRSNGTTAGQSRRIVFHGSSDITVHPSNSERIVKCGRIKSGKLNEIQQTSQINDRQVDRVILRNKNGTSVIEQWTIVGGGHTWFGGNSKGSYTDPKGPNASREMVRFFLEN
jgi:poly(hydroxyalkanoate) depolymerase family esterase